MAGVMPDELGLSGHEAEAVEIQRDPPAIVRSPIGCAGWRHQR
jgi:hypothetical protein